MMCADLTGGWDGYHGPLGELARAPEAELRQALAERRRRLAEWLALTYGHCQEEAVCVSGPRRAPKWADNDAIVDWLRGWGETCAPGGDEVGDDLVLAWALRARAWGLLEDRGWRMLVPPRDRWDAAGWGGGS